MMHLWIIPFTRIYLENQVDVVSPMPESILQSMFDLLLKAVLVSFRALLKIHLMYDASDGSFSYLLDKYQLLYKL